MNSLLEEMESDITRTPSIGDNSLKEMSDLCAEQAAIEDEIKQIGQTTNNLFVGTTAELQKLIKKENVIDVEPEE